MNTETQKIINHSFEYAKELLGDTGEFYPFGAYLDNRGQIHPLEFEHDKKNMPTNGQVIEGLTKYCRDKMKNGEMKGFGITYSAGVQLREGEEAIETVAIDITLASGKIVPVYYFPYRMTEKGKAAFGEIFAVRREDLNAE